MRMRYLGSIGIFSALAMASSLAMAKVTAEIPTPSYSPTPVFAKGDLGPFKHMLGPELTPGLTSSAEGMHFEDNPGINSGWLFIPPDPHCAVGFAHVVDVGNVYIEWRLKAAPSPHQVRMSLDALFAGTPGALPFGTPTVPTTVFDPKVTYDQYAGRFVVVALQRVTSPALDSRILIAVSKTSDPNAGWWLHSINSLMFIGGQNRWADYPGIAADDDALYVTNNMFNAAGTSYAGPRVWVIQKAPTYAGPDGSIVQAVYDFYALSGGSVDLGVGTTTMPTSMWGPEPGGVGTFLVSCGITDGVNEYVSVIRLDTPAAPAWNYQLINVGDISSGTVPSATQLGSSRTIATVAQRVMNAVWRGNSLYTCNTIKPTAGVDSPQATAHWYRLNTTVLGALTVADQGNVGGEDIAPGTHTFMPAVHVDKCDNMAIGFSSSGPAIYASAHYATRNIGDAAGSIGNSVLLAAGLDYYIRTFSTSTTAASRWGDYSGMSLCPVDEATFWVYNEYAGTRGTPTGTQVVEDGRWWTRIGSFSTCQVVAAAISSFSASSKADVVTLRSEFRSNLPVDAVNVYRGTANGSLLRIDTVSPDGTSFTYSDRVAAGKTYRYQIGVVDADGEFMSPIQTVKVRELGATLAQNEPNPFNPSTTIRFTVAEKGNVSLNIYDANGRLVRALVNGVSEAGSREISWDGRDNNNMPVGSGVYFYRLTAGKFSEAKKMVLLK
jgi:hypothetical protein